MDSFLQWLAASGCSVWQILPLGPPVFGRSPYQALSSFALDPRLISLKLLQEEGLVSDLSGSSSCLLEKAAEALLNDTPSGFDDFSSETWVVQWGDFMALKEANGGSPWNRWSRSSHCEPHRADIHRMIQFIGFRQWERVRKVASRLGIRILGDIPVYTALDSADVYFNRKIFKLDPEGNPLSVAGVPPDYFSRTGQLWGNPVYDWEACRNSGFSWWTERIRRTLDLVDMIRMDHFRGFESYWEIPAGSPTAIPGRWEPGPGKPFFDHLARSLKTLPLIAEDLGLITPEVEQLRKDCGFPGMTVLQFALMDRDFTITDVPFDSVVYTGTHDNDTTAGWIRSTGSSLGFSTSEQIVGMALGSPAALAVIPMQDVMGLGSAARMNTPSTCRGNWKWKLKELPETARLARTP